MLEGFKNLFKKKMKKEQIESSDANSKSKEAAKERLHLVLMQDRANVSVDFLDMMKQEIIDVIKKYIDVDESEMDVRITNKINDDGTNGAPALYANIPIVNIKDETRKMANKDQSKDEKVENKDENKDIITEKIEENKDSELEEKIEEKDIKEDVDVDNKEPQDKEGQANKEESQEKAEESKEENVNE